MEYMIIRAADPRLLRQAAALHHDTLSDRSFITALGERFLLRLYEGLLERDLGFLVVARDGERLRGFILACTDSGRLLSVVARAPIAFAASIIPALVRRPWSVGRLVETALYGRRERSRVAAELLVIAVDAEVRSIGIGRRLLTELRRELAARGISTYRVTVHEAMADANRFYAANGLRLSTTFRLYGVRSNLYVDEFDPAVAGERS